MRMSAATQSGTIPTLSIEAGCLPEAWERAVLAVWDRGVSIKTQYDKPDDPPSRDATVLIAVADPFAEPRIHKNFPGGPEELESYRQEVLDGIHDHWIDPAAGKWTYTYHERLFAYGPTDDLRSTDRRGLLPEVDQITYIVQALSAAPHTRRAQAITWMPTADPQTDDPPCLQRLWCRLVAADDGAWVLNMNTHWRSRDLYKAWFMNAYALTDLQQRIAERIAERLEAPVHVGRYVDITDSLHLYGAYFGEIAPEVEKMRTTPWTQRAWTSDHPAFAMMTAEAREKLARNPDVYAKPCG